MGAFGPHRKHFVELRQSTWVNHFAVLKMLYLLHSQRLPSRLDFALLLAWAVSRLHSELCRCFCVSGARARSSLFLTEQHKVVQVRRTGCASPTGVSEVSGLVLCARLH